MPNLRQAVENVIMDGCRRKYAGFEGNGLQGGGLYGGIMIDRYTDGSLYGCGAKRRRSHSKRSGSKRSGTKRRGGARSNYMSFVKAWQRKNPGYAWHEAVRAASADYHKAAHSAASHVGLGARRRRVGRPRVHRRRAGSGVMAAGVMASGAHRRRRAIHGSKRSSRRR
jgi:hypothetical protein